MLGVWCVFIEGLGRGGADGFLPHASMLHPLPDGVGGDWASLHEPLSIAIHGILRQPPTDGDPVLIIGAGIIGLGAVATIKALFPSAAITGIAKYPHQVAAAKALGAHHTVVPTEDGSHFEELAALSGTKARRTPGGVILEAGFPCVVEAVGASGTVTEALRCVDSRGTVVLLGAAGVGEVDLTPVFFKEVSLVGSFCHAHDPGPGGGPDAHSIDRALAIMAAGGFPADLLITHRFPLDDFRTAIEVGMDRAAGAIKVTLHP
ncbi:MAG: zinc-binding dehydrogenase, partial [Acidimicrobiales bacterium]